MQKKFVPMYPTIPNEFKPDPILHPIPRTKGDLQATVQLKDEYYDLDEATTKKTMPDENISEVIRDRVKAAGGRFWAGDNISDYISDHEKTLLISEATLAFEKVLDVCFFKKIIFPYTFVVCIKYF